MKKINQHIEIVSSTIISLSSMGRISRDAAYAVLARHYSDVRITIINNLSDLDVMVSRSPDLVFLGMEFIPANPTFGTQSPRIWLADYLDEREVAYTGSGRAGHELERSKHLAKQKVLDAHLATSPFYVSKQNDLQDLNHTALIFPLFVKPTDRGGGSGIDSNSVIHNCDQLKFKVQSITDNLCSDSLVEEYLPGREFSVAILKNEYSDEYATLPIELIAQPDNNGMRILSKQVKCANTEQAIEVKDELLKIRVAALALNVFKVLGARDYGRIDIRLDRFGAPQFLEANLIPSLIDGYGSFPKACSINLGMTHEDVILHITRLGLTRNSNISEESICVPVISKSFEPAFDAVI